MIISTRCAQAHQFSAWDCRAAAHGSRALASRSLASDSGPTAGEGPPRDTRAWALSRLSAASTWVHRGRTRDTTASPLCPVSPRRPTASQGPQLGRRTFCVWKSASRAQWGLLCARSCRSTCFHTSTKQHIKGFKDILSVRASQNLMENKENGLNDKNAKKRKKAGKH